VTDVPQLLRQRAELEARLRLISYEGSIEVKEIGGANISMYENAWLEN
jgi:hypothetical protein